ncbi:hypothetical protein PV646_02940 [Streptomyces sp. ID05-26A]|nr:hypothetical protein [Streptomyces sp. ID05-26A]
MSTYWLRTHDGVLVRADWIMNISPVRSQRSSAGTYQVTLTTVVPAGGSGQFGTHLEPVSYPFAYLDSQADADLLAFNIVATLAQPRDDAAVLIVEDGGLDVVTADDFYAYVSAVATAEGTPLKHSEPRVKTRWSSITPRRKSLANRDSDES